jgi:hypothetical protein
MIVRLSATGQPGAKCRSVCCETAGSPESPCQVFTPGLGPYYDRFGFLYLEATEISVRVDRIKRLGPLFQAIAASPNLAGLSALVNEIAEAVQKGRSPQGLETLFGEMSGTIKKQVAGKPAPLDWRRVAGLKVESKSRDWVVVVHHIKAGCRKPVLPLKGSRRPC